MSSPNNMSLESSNSHPIFDPAWAIARVKEHFEPQLALADDLVLFGSDLLMRAMESAPKSQAHEVIITVLFRQSLTAADSGFLALACGAIDAASVHGRRLLEARWSLKLALKDPERWGLHLHVASIRETRHLASRLVPGTKEYAEYAAARTVTNAANPPTEASTNMLRQTIAAADAILSRDHLAEISRGFEIGAKLLRREPPWHYDGNAPKEQRIGSIRQLAKTVGCLHEYDTVYKYASYSVHGTNESTHVKRDDAFTAVAPLRTPEGFRSAYMLLASMLVDCNRLIVETYRGGEMESFLRLYNTKWAPAIFSTKDISVQLSPDGGGCAT